MCFINNFTKENEENGAISFLDVKVKRNNLINGTYFNLEIFRKSTYTGLGMNFHSYTYHNFKINNIKTLVYRAINICNSWLGVHKEMKFLINYFKVNSYPENIIYKLINKGIASEFQHKEVKPIAEKLSLFCKIPFINHYSCTYIRSKLEKFLRF